jgi:PAS domain S-box-containing protein
LNELSGYVFSSLREGDIALHRGSGNDLAPILLAAAEETSLGCVERLEHEYALKAELDADWAARPVALTHHNHRRTLVLEDPGGAPLDRLLDRPLDVSHFLRIAIPLAGALRQVHERGLIHKDIKPANILVDAVSGRVWLTGFGIASRLPQEHQTAGPPELIAGTLAYMAPEQTGRMNRSIDSRSDLYALGVTFYQMLTGCLPFTAADPMEWVHCHIARKPLPPSERLENIPASVSEIIMKLLAKTAEERYQTAVGVEADLRRCLAEWEATGCIVPFPLGAHDASDRLLMSEKLYGREREIDALLAVFDRVVAQDTTELVLVSGYSGIGKSSVVNELHKALVPPRGLFASGKFDQYKHDIPYATLGQAFQSLVRSLLTQSEEELGRWREALRGALGPNGQIIVNLVPELEFVIGKQPPVPDLPPQDVQSRFQMVFRRFLGVFAHKEHPLALFLDDLQWLDRATLHLLEHLVTHPEVRHLLLVGAYRDNEVGPAHPLVRMLATIADATGEIQELRLGPLTSDDVGRLVADTLHAVPDLVRPLAELMFVQTGGNPFFTIQFLNSLVDEGLIAFDPGTLAWHWDLDRIRAKGITDNVADLMAGRLGRLPAAALQILKCLACLGNNAQISALGMVLGQSEQEIHAVLVEAVRTGLIFRLEGAYAFVHDRVREAAYALISEDDRAASHLHIGRVLASRTPSQELEEKIFEIVNQFDRATALIGTVEEREQVAELDLIAGRRARSSMAYASALTYLVAGCALLAKDGWERRYDLAFALAFHRAECEFLTGDLAAAEEGLLQVWARAESLVDKAAVTRLRLDLYTTLHRSDRAVEICLDYLRGVDINWSPHPTSNEVLLEYERMWRQLGTRSIEDLADLPPIDDPVCRVTLDVLTSLQAPARFTDQNLPRLIAGRMANLSLEHGNSDATSLGYVWVGQLLTRFGDFEAGFRFGRLGLNLVDERGLDRFKARVYLVFGHSISPWNNQLRTGVEWLRRAFDAGEQTGDLTFAAYARNSLITLRLAAGDTLGDVQREGDSALAFVRKSGFGLIADMLTGSLRLIRTLRGLTAEFGWFDDGEFDESRFEHHLEASPRSAIAACWYWIRKLQARFHAGEWTAAADAASKAEQLLWTSQSNFEEAEYHFYAALARAACCDMAAAEERPQHLEALASHLKQIAVWAANCPVTFANRAALVGAELARLEQRVLDAERLYEEAIRSARANGFIQNEAIAYELAARFYAARGFKQIADLYLRNARYGYLRWGAVGKVQQLDETYPDLRQEESLPGPTNTIGAPVQYLDLATVIKVSQAVSSEIVLEKLLDTLMRTAMVQAGAERALLIMPRGQEPRIEAEATTSGDTVTVRLVDEAVTQPVLPESVLHYVLRTREIVILDDAAAQSPFGVDSYIRQRQARSILCLPLLNQAKLIGVLYLENNLTPRVFAPARISVLKLLASQAAIALENAHLYRDVAEREKQQTATSKMLRIIANSPIQSVLDAVAENAAQLSDANNAEIFRLEDNLLRLAASYGEIPVVIHAYQGVPVNRDTVTGRAACDRRTIHVHDLAAEEGEYPVGSSNAKREGHRTTLGTPLLREGIPIGIILVRRREVRPFSDQQIALIETFADQAVIAVENARLFEAEKQRTLALAHANRDLAGREAKIRRLVDSNIIGIFVWDFEGRVLEANDEFLRMVSYDREDLVSGRIRWADLTPPDWRDRNNARIGQQKGGGRFEPSEKEYTRKDGSRVPVLIGGATFEEGGNQGVAFVLDLTERKRLEERLRVQHTVAQILAEAATIEEAAPRILRAMGECLGWDVGALWRVAREAQALRCVELWHEASIEVPEFERVSREFTFVPGLGLPGRVWSSLEPEYIPDVVPDENFPRVSIAEREGLHAAFGFPILLGGEVLGVIEFFSREIRQPDQELLNMLATIGSQIGQFIERRRAEAEVRASERRYGEVQLELAHANRVATMGQLSASITHEVSQPITAAVTYALAARRWLSAEPPNFREVDDALALIIKQGNRAGEVVGRIRALIKKAPARKNAVEINDAILEVIALTRTEAANNCVSVRTQLTEGLPRVQGDRVQLQQVLLNLIINAIEAMRDVGEEERELLISTRNEPDGVSVEVRDSGPGFAPAALERVFEAFYTTKPGGLGLGLSICRSIIEAHNGRLWASANLPRGASFQFALPAIANTAS